MHPNDLRALLARALDGDLSPEEDAQLAALLKRQPALADELERMAIVKDAHESKADAQDTAAMDDAALNALLASGERHYSRPLNGSQELAGAIARKAAGGKVLSMRNFLYAAGAAAACTLFVVALNWGNDPVVSNNGSQNGPGGPSAGGPSTGNSTNSGNDQHPTPTPVERVDNPPPVPAPVETLDTVSARWIADAVAKDYERIRKYAADNDPKAKVLLSENPSLDVYRAKRDAARPATVTADTLKDIRDFEAHALAARQFIRSADANNDGVLEGVELRAFDQRLKAEADVNKDDKLTLAEIDTCAKRADLFMFMFEKVRRNEAAGSHRDDKRDNGAARGAPGGSRRDNGR